MADESFATGANLTGDLLTIWTNNIQGGVASNLINDPDQPKFDILRGWPLEGAITDHNEMEAQLDPGDASVLVINPGQFVQFGATGKYELGTSPDLTSAAPKKLMCALDSSDSTTVQESGRLPVLTTNYVVRTDQLADAIGTYTVGNSVTIDSGNVSSTVGDSQVVGTIRGVDATLGTVDVEVN